MIAALKASILHWEQIVLKNPAHSPSSHQCALCAKYMHCRNADGEGCHGCPISMRSGHTGCFNTPYEDASDEVTSDGSMDPGSPVTKRQKMLDYLRETLAMVERGEL